MPLHNRNEPDYLIMSCGIAVKKSLEGSKLYYKYLLFPFSNTPVELIFINKAQYDEARYCYRVLDIPRNANKKDIFDSCIYPQEPDVKQWLISKVWYGRSLKDPGKAHDLEFCSEAHLRREYDDIEHCEIGDVNQVWEKILSVHSCSSNAGKANIKSYKRIAYYNSNASEV